MGENISQEVMALQGNTRSDGYTTDEAALLHLILEETRAVRASQEATEKMVKEFIETMSQNPMLKMMGAKFGMKV